MWDYLEWTPGMLHTYIPTIHLLQFLIYTVSMTDN